MKIMDTNMRHVVTRTYSDKFKTRFCFIEDHNWSYSLSHTFPMHISSFLSP